MATQVEIQWIKSDECGHQAVGPPLPVYRPGTFRFSYLRKTVHQVQVSTNVQWNVGLEIRRVVSQESFVIIPTCNPVWKYMGSQ
jgi:hypothetical protein